MAVDESFWQQLGIATNWPILVAVAVLTAVGCGSIAADATANVRMQLIFIAVGAVGMFLFQAVNYQGSVGTHGRSTSSACCCSLHGDAGRPAIGIWKRAEY